jgi:signal transduction histidine kinase
LAPLNNSLELMRLANDDRSIAAEAQSVIQRQVGQLVRLVEDLLDVSRINSGKLQIGYEGARHLHGP